ncbi:FAD-dependent oxidoreductase [Miltoncostaea marina]|uniref:FAD-dependent oxidoreductase n=1 Tax=Miltoncostaea marina TaxID=2843215 RepID=UPI001C3E5280|nr:NAD(P)/FAD-dependent oxidoreductase [Miltoncostaea marina]
MRVVIAGGGMAGLVLARGIAARGGEAVVVERAAADRRIPGPIMLPFQAYDALDELGVLDPIRARGIDVPPLRNGRPVSISVPRQDVVEILREGVDLLWEHELVDLLREGERVVGARVRGPDGERDLPAGIVVGADGTGSRVRELAGIPARTRASDTAFVSFRSPVHAPEPFSIAFLSDGRQVTLLDWAGGSAGGWQIDRVPGGAAEALAPGLDAFRRAFVRLLPQAEAPLAALSSVDELFYREVTEVRCEAWWSPGVALVGEALHAMNPEVGIGSGLGMGDAQALAIAIAATPDDPDAACAAYEHWRRPAVAPYLAVGGTASKVFAGGRRPEEERWPPA